MSISGSSLFTHHEPDGQFSMILLFSSVVMAMAKGVLLVGFGVVMVPQCRFNFILYRATAIYNPAVKGRYSNSSFCCIFFLVYSHSNYFLSFNRMICVIIYHQVRYKEPILSAPETCFCNIVPRISIFVGVSPFISTWCHHVSQIHVRHSACFWFSGLIWFGGAKIILWRRFNFFKYQKKIWAIALPFLMFYVLYIFKNFIIYNKIVFNFIFKTVFFVCIDWKCIFVV